MPLRDMDREQMWLLPPSLDELLALDHPARFVAEFVDALDRESWSELGVEIEGDPLGAPAYHPRALLGVWLYGFMTGVRSCRKLEAACRDQISYLWLTGWQRPDHNTLWRFYKSHRQAMRKLFERTVRTAVDLKLLDLTVQAVDGTKVRANATGDRTYDAEELGRLLQKVEAAIDDLEAQNETGDDEGAPRLPAELAQKKMLREQVRRAMDDLGSQKRHRRINLTDKGAQLMKSPQGIVPSYNAQAMVSPVMSDGQGVGVLVTAVDVVDTPADNGQLVPMMHQAEQTTGTRAELTLADAGYHSGRNLEECANKDQVVVMPEAARQVLKSPYHKDRFLHDELNDSYICPQGHRLVFRRFVQARTARVRLYRTSSGAICRSCPAFGECTTDRDKGRGLGIGPHDLALRHHRAWMSTDRAKQANRRRWSLIESVFGIVKEQMGARRFMLRGTANVASEWTMLATAFNMRVLWKVWRTRDFAPQPTHRGAYSVL